MSLYKKITRNKIENYIKNNNGMSASPSKVGNAVLENYTWRNYSSIRSEIQTLKDDGIVKEVKGRYYA